MYRIEIDTKRRLLRLYNDSVQVREYPVAVGKPSTPTPEGNWTIIKKGLWGAQFGGHFMQLSVPWGIYGIHGTDKPWSIGQALSHGCVRMYSHDAAELYDLVHIGTPVKIY
jgi:lipoprotein-anchoring transpeptidase ErfK/SrfK